jgi:hypothetical protein
MYKKENVCKNKVPQNYWQNNIRYFIQNKDLKAVVTFSPIKINTTLIQRSYVVDKPRYNFQQRLEALGWYSSKATQIFKAKLLVERYVRYLNKYRVWYLTPVSQS